MDCNEILRKSKLPVLAVGRRWRLLFESDGGEGQQSLTVKKKKQWADYGDSLLKQVN